MALDDDAIPKLSKAERLFIAGQVAPSLRRREPRKVTTLDDEGKPVRVVTDVDVAQAALERLGIEIAVQPGKRPSMVLCAVCRKTKKVPRKGPIPEFCSSACYYAAYKKDPRHTKAARSRASKWYSQNKSSALEYQRTYRANPEVRAKTREQQRARRTRAEVRERERESSRERQRARRTRPEVREREREYARKRNKLPKVREKAREWNKRPEAREKARERDRKRQPKRRELRREYARKWARENRRKNAEKLRAQARARYAKRRGG